MTINNTWDASYFIEPLTVHRDTRGVLFEAIRFKSQNIPTGGQIYVYTVEPGERRGDHFHEKKSEWFTCVSGSVRLLMKTASGEKVNEMLDSVNPSMVYAGVGTSHAVINETATVAVIMAYASKEFDPSDPDTVIKQAS